MRSSPCGQPCPAAGFLRHLACGAIISANDAASRWLAEIYGENPDTNWFEIHGWLECPDVNAAIPIIPFIARAHAVASAATPGKPGCACPTAPALARVARLTTRPLRRLRPDHFDRLYAELLDDGHTTSGGRRRRTRPRSGLRASSTSSWPRPWGIGTTRRCGPRPTRACAGSSHVPRNTPMLRTRRQRWWPGKVLAVVSR